MTIVTSTYDEKQAALDNSSYSASAGSAEYTDLLDPSVLSWATVDSPGVASERYTLFAGANNAAYGILGPDDNRATWWNHSSGDEDAYQLGVLPRGVYSLSVETNAWTIEGLRNVGLSWFLTKDGYTANGSYVGNTVRFEVDNVTSSYQLYIFGSAVATNYGMPYKAMLLREGDVGSIPITSPPTPTPISTSDIAKLTSKQISQLSPNQIASLSSDMIAAFTPSNILGLTTAQIPSLNQIQIPAFESRDLSVLTSKQWPAFTTSQIQQFTTTQINKLPSASLARLTTTQVAAFTTAQVSALSPTNVAGLTTNHIKVLSADQIKALETADIVKLTSKQLGVLNTQQVQALDLFQLNKLTSTQLKAMSGDQLGALTSAQIPALSTAFIKGLSTSAISSLSPSFIDVLETKQLAVLGSLQTKALTTAQLEVLSDVQIGALTSIAIKGLQQERFARLSTSQLAGLTSTNIKGLSSAQIATLSSSQIAAIEPIDWKVLTSTQLKGLSASSIAGLSDVHLDFITTTGIKGLPLDAVKAMTTSQIASLSTIQLCALTSAQEAMWSTAQTAVLDEAQAKALKAKTPLALDFSDQGVKTRPLSAGITFDIDADGDGDQVGWIDISMAYLVNDLNANGTIDSGAELFGDATRLSNGSTASDGFEALACLDLNEDGWLDAEDDAFKRLALWQDLNQNGVTEPGELATLDDRGVLRISVTGEDSWTLDQGNMIGAVGRFERSDGSKGVVADIWLETRLLSNSLETKVSELGNVLASYGSETLGDQSKSVNVDPYEDRSNDFSRGVQVGVAVDVSDKSFELSARLGDVLRKERAPYPGLSSVSVYEALSDRTAAGYESLTIKTLGPS